MFVYTLPRDAINAARDLTLSGDNWDASFRQKTSDSIEVVFCSGEPTIHDVFPSGAIEIRDGLLLMDGISIGQVPGPWTDSSYQPFDPAVLSFLEVK